MTVVVIVPCAKLIKTTNREMPCVCELGHSGGCNPFSPNPFIPPTPPEPSIPKQPNGPKSGTVWTEQSIIMRCLWMGTVGCCIYELGHTIGHREETVNDHV